MTGNATKEKRLLSEKSEQRGVVDDSEARDVNAAENRGFLQPPLLIYMIYTTAHPANENRVDKVGIKA